MKKYVLSFIPLSLEISVFLVMNKALQWILAISGLLIAFHIFKKYMHGAYLRFIETVCTVWSAYKWQNLKSLVFSNSERITVRLSWLLLLICLPLCILLVITYVLK